MFKQGRKIGWHQAALGVAEPTAQTAKRCPRNSWVCAQSWHRKGHRVKGKAGLHAESWMAERILSSQGAAQAASHVKRGDSNTMSQEKNVTVRPGPKSPGIYFMSCPGGMQILGPSVCTWMGVGEQRSHPSGMSSTACAWWGSAERPSFLQFLLPIYRASNPRRTFISKKTHACLLSCHFSKSELIWPFEVKM